VAPACAALEANPQALASAAENKGVNFIDGTS
jgi:hypothetical protein